MKAFYKVLDLIGFAECDHRATATFVPAATANTGSPCLFIAWMSSAIKLRANAPSVSQTTSRFGPRCSQA